MCIWSWVSGAAARGWFAACWPFTTDRQTAHTHRHTHTDTLCAWQMWETSQGERERLLHLLIKILPGCCQACGAIKNVAICGTGNCATNCPRGGRWRADTVPACLPGSWYSLASDICIFAFAHCLVSRCTCNLLLLLFLGCNLQLICI